MFYLRNHIKKIKNIITCYSVEEPIEDINVDYNPEPSYQYFLYLKSDNDSEDTVVYKSHKDFDSVSLSNSKKNICNFRE